MFAEYNIGVMTQGTIFTFNVDAGAMLVGIATLFAALLTITWKGREEMVEILETETGPIKFAMNRMACAVTEIQTILKNNIRGLTIMNSIIERSTSPLRLTNHGASLIRESGLEKILNDNKELLCAKLKAKLPQNHTEYDVQENARKLLNELKNDSLMNPVKTYVYDHPMDMEMILNAGGLWLRDDFLKQPRRLAKDESASTSQSSS